MTGGTRHGLLDEPPRGCDRLRGVIGLTTLAAMIGALFVAGWIESVAEEPNARFPAVLPPEAFARQEPDPDPDTPLDTPLDAPIEPWAPPLAWRVDETGQIIVGGTV